MHIRLIYIDKVYFAFSKGWVVSLDYGTTAIVALLSGQLQVHIEDYSSFIETYLNIYFLIQMMFGPKALLRKFCLLSWLNDDCHDRAVDCKGGIKFSEHFAAEDQFAGLCPDLPGLADDEPRGQHLPRVRLQGPHWARQRDPDLLRVRGRGGHRHQARLRGHGKWRES